MTSSPTVTVLLPAYNAAAWLGPAVASVLNQSFTDFELLVIDDGSTDRTAEVLSAYTDPRIRLVREPENRGLVGVLNHGIELARGSYIARMDADDVAHARRLERQVAFLEGHLDVGICGSAFRVSGRKRPGRVRPPIGHDRIAAALFFRSALGHPTVMFRRSFLVESGLRYKAAAQHAEDYDLWVRARGRTRFANLPDYLLEYRLHPDQMSAEHQQAQLQAADRIRLEQLTVMLPKASDDEKRLHLRTCDGYVFATASELIEARAWLDFLLDANAKAAMFTPRAFEFALAAAWAYCCQRTTLSPGDTFRIFASRRYSKFGLEALRRHLAFACRILRPSAGT